MILLALILRSAQIGCQMSASEGAHASIGCQISHTRSSSSWIPCIPRNPTREPFHRRYPSSSRLLERLCLSGLFRLHCPTFS